MILNFIIYFQMTNNLQNLKLKYIVSNQSQNNNDNHNILTSNPSKKISREKIYGSSQQLIPKKNEKRYTKTPDLQAMRAISQSLKLKQINITFQARVGLTINKKFPIRNYIKSVSQVSKNLYKLRKERTNELSSSFQLDPSLFKVAQNYHCTNNIINRNIANKNMHRKHIRPTTQNLKQNLSFEDAKIQGWIIAPTKQINPSFFQLKK